MSYFDTTTSRAVLKSRTSFESYSCPAGEELLFGRRFQFKYVVPVLSPPPLRCSALGLHVQANGGIV